MSFELFVDGFESGTNVQTTFLDNLARLALVQDPNGPEDKKRPPKSTKYTMFLPDGTPVRATCRVAVREAAHLAVKV